MALYPDDSVSVSAHSLSAAPLSWRAPTPTDVAADESQPLLTHSPAEALSVLREAFDAAADAGSSRKFEKEAVASVVQPTSEGEASTRMWNPNSCLAGPCPSVEDAGVVLQEADSKALNFPSFGGKGTMVERDQIGAHRLAPNFDSGIGFEDEAEGWKWKEEGDGKSDGEGMMRALARQVLNGSGVEAPVRLWWMQQKLSRKRFRLFATAHWNRESGGPVAGAGGSRHQSRSEVLTTRAAKRMVATASQATVLQVRVVLLCTQN